ncbi:MAG: hypothetical protein ACI4MA_11220 [Treponema sp.]
MDSIAYTASKNSTTNAEATASINYTNPTDSFARGMRLFNNKKKGITANIVMQNMSNSSDPGVMGFTFDMVKNDDGTYNFCLFGIRNNGGHARAYITYYKNISESNFSADNFGVASNDTTRQKDITGWKKGSNSATENNGFVEFDDIKVANGQLSCVVEIEALATTAIDTGNDEYLAADQNNAYNVRIYTTPENGNLSEFNGLSNKKDSAKTAITNKAVYSVVIPRTSIDDSSTKTIEAKMGFYANVYAGQTLKGEWQVADMKHNPNGIFWCDEENVSRAAVANSNPMGIELVK